MRRTRAKRWISPCLRLKRTAGPNRRRGSSVPFDVEQTEQQPEQPDRAGIHGPEFPEWPPRARRDDDEPTGPIVGLTAAAEPEPMAQPMAQPIPESIPDSGDGPVIDEPTDELPIVVPSNAPAAVGRRALVIAAIAGVVLLAGAVIALDQRTEPPRATGGQPTEWAAATPADRGHAASAALDGRTEAGFDLVDGASAISLRTADLGGELYRVSTAAGDGAHPRTADQDGRIRLFLDRGPGQNGPVQIVLSSRVRWSLRIGGGTNLSTIDLSGARLGEVDLSGGAGHIDLTLPPPDGTLTVRMTGGVSRFDVHTADLAPVRVRVGSGAGSVVLDGQSHAGVAAGAEFAPARWKDTVNRIDVDAVAGMSALTIDGR
jgi:hypothetical protein